MGSEAWAGSAVSAIDERRLEGVRVLRVEYSSGPPPRHRFECATDTYEVRGDVPPGFADMDSLDASSVRWGAPHRSCSRSIGSWTTVAAARKPPWPLARGSRARACESAPVRLLHRVRAGGPVASERDTANATNYESLEFVAGVYRTQACAYAARGASRTRRRERARPIRWVA